MGTVATATRHAWEVEAERAEPRAALAEAVRCLNQANEALKQSMDTLARARVAIDKAEADLARFADLDERIAADRAEAVRQSKNGPLPDSLIAEREQCRMARERAGEAHAALKLLEAEQKATEQAQRAADEAASIAATRVLVIEARTLSDELREAHQRVWHLQDCLSALDRAVQIMGQRLPDTDLRRRALSAELWKLIQPLNMQRPSENSTMAGNRVRADIAKWLALHGELMRDPASPVLPEAL